MRIGFIAACLILCCNSIIFASPPVTIILKAKAFVDDAVIQLSDIADIRVTDPVKSAKLATVRIGKTPQPGKSLLIHETHVRSKLRLFGLSPSDYNMVCSGPVQVVRRSQEVSPDAIRQVVRDYIETNSPWTADQLKINNIRRIHPVQVPPGKMRIHVRHPKHTDWLGPVPFSVSFSVRGHLVKKISVPATIEVWSDVIVAAKPLGRNQPVSPGSIKVVRMNLSRAPANAILSKGQVVGMRVNRSIAANSILRSDQIEIPPVVKRGDLVQVLAQSKGMKISVKGVAKQNGGIGERIRVQNMRSKRIIYAQVLDDQTVQVDF